MRQLHLEDAEIEVLVRHYFTVRQDDTNSQRLYGRPCHDQARLDQARVRLRALGGIIGARRVERIRAEVEEEAAITLPGPLSPAAGE